MEIFNHQHESFLNIDDSKVYYEIMGNRELPALLFLHGGIGNIEEFNSLTAAFINSYFIIGIDSRGHGRSTLGKKELSYELLQSDVETILEHIGVKELSIIGFSDGGVIGMRVALSHRLKVISLVAIGTGWHYETNQESIEMYRKINGPWWREKHPEYFSDYQRLNPNGDFNALVEKSVRMWLDHTDSGYPNERVKELNCPLLLIRGDDDHLTSIDSQTELMKMVPETKFLNLPFAGHTVHTMKPSVCAEYISHFLVCAYMR